MVSLEPIVLSALPLLLVVLGYTFVFRVEAATALQRRYAESLSSTPPSENPEYYEETYEHRKAVFRLGGVVLLVVGLFLLAMVVYGTVFVESFP
jgi:hypothetical protein